MIGHYRGAVRLGVPHGHGSFTRQSTGWKCEGDWVNGDRHGSFRELWPDGPIFEGRYVRDAVHGRWLETLNNIEQTEHIYEHGRRIKLTQL